MMSQAQKSKVLRYIMSEYYMLGILVAVLILGGLFLFYSRADGRSIEEKREQMVRYQLKARDIKDERVLEAMSKVERHKFVPSRMVPFAYEDHALPIGHDQTISQPYIVALMTQLLQPDKEDIVLEIGTGSGYQAAILAELVKEVYTIEIVEPLGKQAKERLKDLGYKNVEVKIGDGYKGWPKKAPFDKIIVTAAPEEIPDPLIEQLKEGGRMVIPVGDRQQRLMVVKKTEEGLEKQSTIPVIFVPMTGEAQEKD